MSFVNSPSWQEQTIRHWMKMARIKQWLGVTAAQSLEDEADRQRKNREAEEAMVRKQVWKSDEQAGEDEMRQTILGDYHINQTLPPRPGPNLAPVFLGLGLLAVGVGLPVAAYLYSLGPTKQESSPSLIQQTGLEEDTTILLTLPEWQE